MTTLLMMGIVIFGIAGYRSLPVSDLPNVDFPTIQVSAPQPGASPETMAALWRRLWSGSSPPSPASIR